MEWPIDRQERDRQKCPTQIINSSRSIGSREKKKRVNNKGKTLGKKPGINQIDIRSSEIETYKMKEK